MCAVSISPAWLEAGSVFAATLLAGYAVVKELRDGRSRRRSVDAAISADAYAARRSIRAWVVGVQRMQASEAPTFATVGIAGKQDSAAVEERLQRMVAAAPQASRAVQRAVREAYVLYYKAKGPGPQPPESLADLQATPQHVVPAQERALFGDLQACLARLTDAIEPELRER